MSESFSWHEETERAQRKNLESTNVSKPSEPIKRAAFTSSLDDLREKLNSNHVSSITLQQPKLLKSIHDAPPKLVNDPQVKTLLGDSAYFTGGEYRKPDTRTIYIEGLERMYNNTMQPAFTLLPKEAIEHHIKGAEKYWDKFLEAHNLLYNNCDTVEGIETHRVVHRNACST